MNHRFTRIDLLIVIVVIAVSLAILLPILSLRREAQRRATCLNNQKQIALAFQVYASTFNNAFPPSGQLVKAPDGARSVGGFSFLVKLLSFLGDDSFNSHRSVPLSFPTDGDLEDFANKTSASNAVHESVSARVLIDLIKKQPAEFLCPSSRRMPACEPPPPRASPTTRRWAPPLAAALRW